jgi:biopolymer transport protein ExbD
VADTKPGVSESPPIIVTVTTNPPYLYLGKLPVTFDRLQSEFASRVKASPNITLAIRADTEAAYGNVVKVTEAARLAQVKQIKAYLKPSIRP